MRAADLARLVALAAIWGLSFVFLRVPIAALTLAAWFRLTGFEPG